MKNCVCQLISNYTRANDGIYYTYEEFEYKLYLISHNSIHNQHFQFEYLILMMWDH